MEINVISGALYTQDGKKICGDIKQIPEVYGHQKRRSSYPFNDRECQRENGCSWV